MNEGPQKLSRGCLLGELSALALYAFFVIAYDCSAPPSVRNATSIVAHVAVCLFFFAAILGLLNLSMRQGISGHRIRGLILLVGAILMLPILLFISFPQY